MRMAGHIGKNGQKVEALYINNKSAAFINCRVLSFRILCFPVEVTTGSKIVS